MDSKLRIELTWEQMHEAFMMDLLDQLEHCDEKKIKKALQRVLEYNVTPTERAVLEKKGIL